MDKPSSIWWRFAAAIVAISFSIAGPLVYLARYDNPFPKVPTSAVSFLALMQGAVTAGYVFIEWVHYRQLRKSNTANVGSIMANHVLPMALLTCMSNLTLGLMSWIGFSYCGRGADTGAGFGLAPVEVFPQTYVVSGVLVYAFWGAFIFSAYRSLQRIVNDDFPPNVWVYSAVRLGAAMLAAIFVAIVVFPDVYTFDDLASLPVDACRKYVAATLSKPPPFGHAAGLAALASFMAGAFPMATLRSLFQTLTDRISQAAPVFGKYTYTPLTILDGITRDVQERLSEAGIDSIQLLSRSNVDKLKDPVGLALPYPEDVLIDWIDQARLALYFTEEAEVAAIRTLGIRTYGALKEFQKKVQKDPTFLDKIDSTPIPKERFQAFVRYGVFPELPDAKTGKSETAASAPGGAGSGTAAAK